MPPRAGGSPPLLTIRSAVVLLLAIAIGIITYSLSRNTGFSVDHAILYAGGATGGAILFFNKIIDVK